MANFITIFRVFLVFFIMYLLMLHDKNASIWAFWLTIIAFWFDGLDGFVARKFHLTSKLGAVLDIMGDRIVENAYWITFAVLGWVPLTFPLIILSRSIITDSLRSVALEQGLTAFGKTSMQNDKLGHFICASNFSRGTYAVVKALAFMFLILGYSNAFEFNILTIYKNAGAICALIAVQFCVVRALPVIFESKRFFEK